MSGNEVVRYESIEGVNENQWNNVIENAEHGSVFHRYGWLKALEEGLGLEPRHVTVEKGGSIRAMHPNFLADLDLPFDLPAAVHRRALGDLQSIDPGFGGPIITSNKERFVELLLDDVADLADGNVVRHRIRTFDPGYVRYARRFEQFGYRPSLTSCRFEADLTRDPDEIRSAMDKSKRKNLEKARENDPTVTAEPISEEMLRPFHRVYGKNMERVGGRTYPLRFFESLCRNLSDRTVVFTARVDDEVIGRMIQVVDDEQDALHALFSAIQEDHFRYYPSELLYVEAMKWARERGYSTFDFGDTSADFADGVFQHKREFGGRAVPILAWERGLAPLRWNAYRIGRRLYSRRSADGA